MAQGGADSSGMEQWRRWEGVGLGVQKQLDVLMNWTSPVREGKKKSRNTHNMFVSTNKAELSW